ncbi:MAG: SDR family oxidoreductase [Rhodothermales bacterium]|nr:SDR family oxidoreductase [Rhodothermales bacterium]
MHLTDFEGKVALVTGAASGVGEAVARVFAARGASGLLVTDRQAERGALVARTLNAGGCPTLFVDGDLESVEACRRIVEVAYDRFGAVHVLVNAAGLSTRGSIYDTSVALWDRLMAVNVRAPFILTQACVNRMVEQRIEGAIVNVSSVVSTGGLPTLCPYAASKGALSVFTKNVAYAVMRHRIRVNALLLGWTDTPVEDVIQREVDQRGDDWREQASERLPFGRLIQPEEAARAIAWMASAESGLMTGSLVHFDQSVPGGGGVNWPAPGEAGTYPLDEEAAY